MVIDFHVHCFPDELAPRAVSALSQCAGIPPRVEGTIKNIKESMRVAKVDKSVVLSIATKPSQTEKVNTWAGEIQSEEIIAFGSIHPEYEDWKKELERIKGLGIKGIKYHPDYQGFYVDDERMFPVYEYAFQLGMILIFHAGVDIGLSAPFHCTPDRLQRLVHAFPGGKVVAAHMGGFDYWDQVETFLVGENIYFDTSYSFDVLPQEQMKRIIHHHGAEKILFATDSPWKDQTEEIEKLKALKLSQSENLLILGNNAKHILGI